MLVYFEWGRHSQKNALIN